MSFGLTNSPASFMHLMNRVFKQYLDLFVIIFIDDIIIYLGNEEELETYLRVVLQNLKDRTRVDSHKIEEVKQWPRSTSPKDIKSFLGLAGYYRRFIEGFSSIASPLTKLTHKKVKFQWSDECEKSFSELKTRLTTTLVLTLPKGSNDYVIYCDASRVGLGCVSMQRDVRRRDLEFEIGDWIFLKVSPMKGVMRFGKKGKLSPRYTLQNLEKDWLRNKEVVSVMVLWRSQYVEGDTWEAEAAKKEKYPHLFSSDSVSVSVYLHVLGTQFSQKSVSST
ncbi:hypothetical protein MTR67_051799 [Solanum verrucosum]|uniref:Reverse transcriptase domain-containing protein n=1 Tax=Solanum verrucosum TaxID=315347 RepID=A0AAF1A319_SOLVR|nr:hypothetical protein MTR67_051799 [Solanum verrucosum]